MIFCNSFGQFFGERMEVRVLTGCIMQKILLQNLVPQMEGKIILHEFDFLVFQENLCKTCHI